MVFMSRSGISVLMTAKDASSTIRKSIMATLKALDDDSEIQVLADGCSDDTVSSVKQIKDRRIKLHVSHQTLGRSAGRNLLAQEASKKLLAVTDSDDLDLPWRFNMLRKGLESADAVFANHILFGKPIKTGILPSLPIPLKNDQIRKILLFKNPLNHCTSLFTKTAFMELGMYPDFDSGEDYDLWLRMAISGMNLRRLPGYATLYRQHEKQSIRSNGFRFDIASNQILQSRRKLLASQLGVEIDFDNESNIIEFEPLLDALVGKSAVTRFEITGLPAKVKRLLKGIQH
jgi:glycosyltransferase involved in cell wall biosynthesis